MNFLTYDLIFLVAFLLFFSIFLYTRKRNLKREGLLFLYKTSWGIKIINYVGKRNKRTLHFLSYISIITGYLLMIGVLWLIYRIVEIYFFQPAIVRAIKVPPILPLFPYVPQIFSLDFLPPFYFTYWIIILAVIAISHELFHGFFAAHNDVKIKTTGFGFFPFFLPIFLAAFVELDEKIMATKKKFAQMAILSAGTFANVIVAILFFIVLWIFFSLSFASAGLVYDSYATSNVALAGITSVGGIMLDNPTYQQILNNTGKGLTEIKSGDETYLANKKVIEAQSEDIENLIVYSSAPAINENLSSTILKINNIEIRSIEDLQTELSKYNPRDKIIITTLGSDSEIENEIILGEHPELPGEPWIGIGFFDNSRDSIMGKIVELTSFKKPHVYYEPKFDGFSTFVYNLLWWLVLISISVALINMLPVGIFDGGRFFYLTVLGITGSKNIAKKAFKFSTNFFLFLLLLIMIFWAISFF